MAERQFQTSRLIGALLLVLALFALAPGVAHAQGSQFVPGLAKQPAQSQAPSADDIDSLIKTLDDAPAREKLKQQLQLLLQAQRGQGPEAAAPAAEAKTGLGAWLFKTISTHVEAVSDGLVGLVEAVADFPQRMRRAAQALTDPVVRQYWLDVVIALFSALVAAFGAAFLMKRLMLRPRRVIQQQQTQRWLVRFLYVPLIFVFESLPAIAFAVAAGVTLSVLHPNDDANRITTAICLAQIAASVTSAMATALLTPAAPSLRVIRFTDETAAYLRLWVRRLAVVSFYGYAVTELTATIQVDPNLQEVLRHAWGLLIAGMAIIFVFQNRIAVALWIAGGQISDPTDGPTDEPVANPLDPQSEAGTRKVRFGAFRRQVGKVWHFLAILYILAIYVVSTLSIEGGIAFLVQATILSVILLLVVRLADQFVREVFNRSFALSDDLKRMMPGLESRANRYLPVLQRTLLVGVYLVGASSLLQIWGFDMIGWVSEGSGRTVMAGAFKILIIVVVSALLSELVNLAIEHYLREQDYRGKRIYHSGRIRTLLPMLRNAFRITLGVIILLVVLSQIGVDIAPLLAAAGVVGLAVGFGAQTLVKDIITGVFILLEDTIAIGDVVDLGGHAGVVEGMTIRTIRLRDGTGTVHTVPFSAVTIVENKTKDFSYATFDLTVDYREDLDGVLEAIKDVGTEIAKDSSFRYGIIGPLEVIGVDAFQSSGVLVKARIKTRPMSQWDVMRAFNLRLKRLFDERGLRFPGVMAATPAPPPPPEAVREQLEAKDAPEFKDTAPHGPVTSTKS